MLQEVLCKEAYSTRASSKTGFAIRYGTMASSTTCAVMCKWSPGAFKYETRSASSNALNPIQSSLYKALCHPDTHNNKKTKRARQIEKVGQPPVPLYLFHWNCRSKTIFCIESEVRRLLGNYHRV